MPQISQVAVRSAIEVSGGLAEAERKVNTTAYRKRIISVAKSVGRRISNLSSLFKGGKGLTPGNRPPVAPALAGREKNAADHRPRYVMTVTAEVHAAPPVSRHVGQAPTLLAQTELPEHIAHITHPQNPARTNPPLPFEVRQSRFRSANYRQSLNWFTARESATADAANNPRARTGEYSYEAIRTLVTPGWTPMDAGLAARATAAIALAQAMGEVPLRPIEQAVAAWYPPERHAEITENWRTHGEENPRDAEEFSKFLDKLGQTASAKLANFRAFAVTWLSQLSAAPDLLDETLKAARQASSSCHDRISLTFNEMQQLRVVDDIKSGKYDQKIPGLGQALRNIFRLQCVEVVAVKAVYARLATLKETLGPERLARIGANDQAIDAELLKGIEEIEVHIAFQLRLRDKLKLNVGIEEMRYGATAALTDSDILAAENIVKERENTEFTEWFANSHHWDAMLQRAYPEKHAAFLTQRAEAFEMLEETLTDDIAAEIAQRGLTDDADTRHGVGMRLTNQIGEDLKRSLTREVLALEGHPGLLAPVW